ncbi:type I restriction endonuclease subunit R [Reichenbachiella agariperforans]|uniref:type I restriction endonuclease subunit R n=1 Tax=Reichenbachiella agariperforans TaxID=156994 RepID=UPI001C09CF38|nr:type I restriction endonuclease [Reichenbachiella agariperforans]MBU2915958.1 DEAD/DEAH box helicase family protein [Reichenbachiella agariperforans]
MIFNEDTRVKIPTILHLVRLGYEYISLKDNEWDSETNIFKSIFDESISRINPEIEQRDVNRLFEEISLDLENEDLGRAFYHELINRNSPRLIDFEDFNNNSFHVVTELPYEKDDDNFRPDIILLINGMPLVFIEVKKPNNKDGIQAEHKRIDRRFRNKKFRKFVNLTQLMVFSNNMEYDDDELEPIQGAFYSTTSYGKPAFNYFREDQVSDLNVNLSVLDPNVEDFVLKDTNYVGIKGTQEYQVNKHPDRPTNRICTSLFQKDRLAFLLQYAIAYVEGERGVLEKHVMRYPQIFATKAIERELEEGVKKGIIWHTQGSGKTALSYYNVRYLTDYFQQKQVIPKFYFIVDRIDLADQASKEFRHRGLIVHTINSRDQFAQDIKSTTVLHNASGKPEITVVNIQKFKDDRDVVRNSDYNLNIQRVYFMDEVHRSYNPKGSFLANLNESDQNAIKIGLTGTPLIGDNLKSTALFGGYIHKYYYNASIADGYTLRLIREEIETNYKLALEKTLEEIELLKGDSDRKQVYAHHKFVEPMLEYILKDFEKARITHDDPSIGGMVICDSADQAKMMHKIFEDKYTQSELPIAAEPEPSYGDKRSASYKPKTAALILHDIGTKSDREKWVKEFKAGNIDFIFVFNMLLTGFDAKRLKKLYLGRVIKAHNLLQALTRVNRTYKNYRYGYVVDFADIKKEFDKTNQQYWNELQTELGDEMDSYSNLFKTQEEIELEIQEVKEVLFHFDTNNAENFSKQINEISDRGKMLEITRALNNAKSLYNLIRLSGNYELLEQLDFQKLTILSREANNRLAKINLKESMEEGLESTSLLNVALEDVLFSFTKVREEEMLLADEYKEILRKTREGLAGNFDQGDPEFISLKEELERLFKKKKLNEITKEQMEENIKALEKIYAAAKELERKNQLLKAKYANDAKYARLHKRLSEKDPLTDSETKLFEALQSLKEKADQQVLSNSNMLENESFVEKMMMRLVIQELKNKHQLNLNLEKSRQINSLLVKEYLDEYHGRAA